METHPFFSFDVNEIRFSSSYTKIREILGKQFGESSHLKCLTIKSYLNQNIFLFVSSFTQKVINVFIEGSGVVKETKWYNFGSDPP